MTFNCVLIDTNICLDLIFDNPLFSAPALEISERSELGDFKALVSAHSFDTLFYVLKKRLNKTKAKNGIKDIRKAFEVAPVTETVIDTAIDANWNDFEDAIHYQAALAADCDAIITRNAKDFNLSELPVLSPQQFLDHIDK